MYAKSENSSDVATMTSSLGFLGLMRGLTWELIWMMLVINSQLQNAVLLPYLGRLPWQNQIFALLVRKSKNDESECSKSSMVDVGRRTFDNKVWLIRITNTQTVQGDSSPHLLCSVQGSQLDRDCKHPSQLIQGVVSGYRHFPLCQAMEHWRQLRKQHWSQNDFNFIMLTSCQTLHIFDSWTYGHLE